eukprot:Lithocolla_globosa_v1_NODE_601_length_3621_cov_48.971957.p1 type:complete len:487 gc:universal NODE_601_length_3621_cov_48.971957:2038-3498(+)
MRTAAIGAGLVPKVEQDVRLKICLEPVAAMMLCRQEARLALKPENGFRFLSIHFGSETIEIVFYQINGKGNLEEISPPTSELGVSYIDREFLRRLQMPSHTSGCQRFLASWEKHRNVFTGTETTPICFEIPFSLVRQLMKNAPKNVQNEFLIDLEESEITITVPQMKDIFEPVLQRLHVTLKKVLDNQNANKVCAVCVSGCVPGYLYTSLIDRFPQCHFLLRETGVKSTTAILEGAVYLGIETIVMEIDQRAEKENDELTTFLTSLGLSSEVPRFQKEQVTMASIQLLTKEEFRSDLGLALGPTKLIMDALQSVPVTQPTVALPSGFSYHCFHSHDWGTNGDNHLTVTRVTDALKERGIMPWFDSERMEDHIRNQMCKGIDASVVIVVFLTKRYMMKVNGKNRNDNCKLEFDYAFEKRSCGMIAVPMEPGMLDPNGWDGQLKMCLGSYLYKANFASDNAAQFQKNINALYNEIVRLVTRQANGGER